MYVTFYFLVFNCHPIIHVGSYCAIKRFFHISPQLTRQLLPATTLLNFFLKLYCTDIGNECTFQISAFYPVEKWVKFRLKNFTKTNG